MAEKREIRRKVAHITLAKPMGETFSVYSISTEYFKDYTLAQYDNVYKREWNKVHVYTSQLFKEMRLKGFIRVVGERDRGNGLIKEKILNLAPPGRPYLESITRGEEV